MRIVRALSASARATAWRIHHVAYVENLKPLRWSNFSAARTRPIVPSWIRSRKGRPWLRYFLAIETTRRRFASSISSTSAMLVGLARSPCSVTAAPPWARGTPHAPLADAALSHAYRTDAIGRTAHFSLNGSQLCARPADRGSLRGPEPNSGPRRGPFRARPGLGSPARSRARAARDGSERSGRAGRRGRADRAD